LKPIAEEELQAAVVKVTEEIKQKRKSEKFMELVKQQMIQNQDYLRDVFFNEWMEGKLSRFEWEEQARFLDMDFPDNMILILVSVQSSYDKKIDKGTVTEEIYKITLEKIIRELMEPYHTVSVFSSKYEDVAIVMEKLPENFQEFSADLQLQTEEKVGGKCFITARECTFETLPDISREMRREVQKMQECRPIVQDARKYIYANYQDRNLDLRQVAHAIGCNSSYISRIMKQELGISFKDFLTRLRISQAVRLMEDRELSINQIAEKVGYSNQHYFSAAFKNCQGMSPSEFRKNMLQIDRNGL
jgi:two-component system response regulator YesN